MDKSANLDYRGALAVDRKEEGIRVQNRDRKLKEEISMNRFYSTLVAVVVFVLFATSALADPGKTWEKKINGAGRFQVLNQFAKAAVFDKETGRVWERSPDTSTFDWFGALAHCYALEVGGRKGWRLPTIEELASLVDASQPAPTLPSGHPFSNVQSSNYWSATTFADNTGFAWSVFFDFGGVDLGGGKTGATFVWYVRGGQGIDGVQ
jgi:hypothetical protein